MKLQKRLDYIIKKINKNKKESIIGLSIIGAIVGIVSTTILVFKKTNNSTINQTNKTLNDTLKQDNKGESIKAKLKIVEKRLIEAKEALLD
ncbi:hypothetical protein GC105_01320 [Alkalibaculum sp. M08DMB]|uniref:Uncharacterized protein n=1 Tax=Alkalibaculum sporogenes TaxID=2655001 RepID=A0A6A7K4R1_9FIRM|nr:hypothetical protein [Alkalibaculum sporogenes]MPW24432.1 hypothetical protein [Alkalibaculum sporogenes]